MCHDPFDVTGSWHTREWIGTKTPACEQRPDRDVECASTFPEDSDGFANHPEHVGVGSDTSCRPVEGVDQRCREIQGERAVYLCEYAGSSGRIKFRPLGGILNEISSALCTTFQHMISRDLTLTGTRPE